MSLFTRRSTVDVVQVERNGNVGTQGSRARTGARVWPRYSARDGEFRQRTRRGTASADPPAPLLKEEGLLQMSDGAVPHPRFSIPGTVVGYLSARASFRRGGAGQRSAVGAATVGKVTRSRGAISTPLGGATVIWSVPRSGPGRTPRPTPAWRKAGVVVAVLGVLSGGCGQNDEDAVRSVASKLAKSDPALCEAVTAKLAHDAWGGRLGGCRRELAALRTGKRGSVTQVDAGDRTATATTRFGGHILRLRLVKRDDEWKVAAIEQVDRPEPKAKPIIRNDLDPDGVMDAYLAAIRDGDGPALCGLLTERAARQVISGEKSGNPLSECADQLAHYDWRKTRRESRNVKIVKVSRAGNKARVTLSSGKHALIRMYQGRWAIHSIR